MSSTQISAVGRTVMSAQPYAWPYHGRLRPRDCALIACVDPMWRVPRPESDAADERLDRLAMAVHSAGGLVICLTALPMRRPRGIAAMSAGPRVANPVRAPQVPIVARGTSGFYGSRLEPLLRAGGYTDLLVAGWGLEGPVHSTLRAANDRGYECLLVQDACASLTSELAFNACEMVRFSGGIFGAFADAQDVINVLAGDPAAQPKDRSTP